MLYIMTILLPVTSQSHDDLPSQSLIIPTYAGDTHRETFCFYNIKVWPSRVLKLKVRRAVLKVMSQIYFYLLDLK